MTEKRFTLNKDTEWWFVDDNTIEVDEYGYRNDLTGEDKYRGFKQTLTEQEVVDLLNEQHETIERLKDNCKVLDEVKCEMAEENEQLKEQNADWETAFNNCKHYKEAYGTEIVKIKQTIKDMMENERTELGRSVLKQLWEAIQ